ncbi:MAG: hypothetical protein ACWGMZ_02275 [Thermoguttaceae bacterium]
MSNSSLDIDRVVREVIAELKSAESGVQAAPATKRPAIAKSTSASSSVASAGNGELTVSSQVVTLADLSGKLRGVSRVKVNPRAVITPAVRDTLRQRNIMLSRESPSPQSSGEALRLVIDCFRAKSDPKALANALEGVGVKVQCYKDDCLIAATDRLGAELKNGKTLGILLTPYTASALCLANRLSGVRAILATDAKRLARDIAAVGANLLVVDPQSIGFFKLSQLAGAYCRGGVKNCPEVFRERLM